MKTTLITSILVGLCGVASARQIDNSTITAFDLERYLGKWYEVARYDHAFERGLVGTTAE